MFDRIRKIITSDQEIKESSIDEEKKIHVASCVMLLEASHIDEECHDDEMDHLVETLKDKFGIPGEEADELIELSHDHRKNAVDLWEFSNHINQTFSKQEKIAVMEDVWRIIHIDGKLDMYEDAFAHRVANLLRLTHKQLIDAKLKARDQLKNRT